MKILADCVVVMGRAWIALYRKISSAPMARERTEVLTMRLIDADAILKADENSDKALVLGSGKALEIAYALLKKKVADAPTVDAVIVTRCKDCKHLCVWNRKDIYAFCPKTNIVFLPFDKDTRTFFCSFGKRKDGKNG